MSQLLSWAGGGAVAALKNPTQELSSDPNPNFLKSTDVQMEAYCRTNGRRTAIQMGGVLLGFPFFKAQKTLLYKLKVYCSTCPETSRGDGVSETLLIHCGTPGQCAHHDGRDPPAQLRALSHVI